MLTDNIKGALWVIAAGVAFTFMGTITKFLGQSFDSLQISFFRALFGLCAIAPFIAKLGMDGLRTKRPGMHLIRSIIGTCGMLCGFYAITHLSFADAISISYARALFLIPLAVLFLGEVVRRRRWTATLIGFIGVIVMLRPGGDFSFVSVVALTGAVIVAVVTVLIKKLSDTERPETMLLYFGIVSTLATAIPAYLVWRQPNFTEVMMLVAVGAIGAGGQYCTIRGFKLGEATAVLPFDYCRLLFATIVGIAVFGEFPDAWTITGAGIIVASTLYIALREAGLGKRQKPTSPSINPPVLSDR